MSVPGAEPAFRQPNWMHDFRAWVARLSPAAVADLIDVLAVELQGRNIGDHVALGKAAATVRKHHLARLEQLVDAFLDVQSPSGGLPCIRRTALSAM